MHLRERDILNYFSLFLNLAEYLTGGIGSHPTLLEITALPLLEILLPQ